MLVGTFSPSQPTRTLHWQPELDPGMTKASCVAPDKRLYLLPLMPAVSGQYDLTPLMGVTAAVNAFVTYGLYRLDNRAGHTQKLILTFHGGRQTVSVADPLVGTPFSVNLSPGAGPYFLGVLCEGPTHTIDGIKKNASDIKAVSTAFLMGNTYAYLDAQATLPAEIETYDGYVTSATAGPYVKLFMRNA